MNKYQILMIGVGIIVVTLTLLMPPHYTDSVTMTIRVNWGRLLLRLVVIAVSIVLSVLILGRIFKK